MAYPLAIPPTPALFVDSDPASVYRPLDASRREIRLLTIAPTDTIAENEIRCTLESVSLNGAQLVDYIGLSYMWGPTEGSLHDHVTIYLNGHRVRPSLNLVLALMYLRVTSNSGDRFWIDALCINQADIVEKSAQVSEMRYIYSNAREVYAWLISAPESELAVSKLDSLRNLIASAESPKNFRTGMLDMMRNSLFEGQQDYRMFWEGFCQLCDQEYWSRTWIIQELKSAKSVKIVCGASKADFSSLHCVTMAIAKLLEDVDPHESQLFSQVLMASYRPSWITMTCFSDENFTLSKLLSRFSHAAATDPRDKIYSLLGIAQNQSLRRLPIDYSLPWPSVFKSTTKHIIQTEGRLDIIAEAASVSDELPTWVPDWTTQHIFASASRGDLNLHLPSANIIVKAGLSAGGSTIRGVSFSDNDTKLTTRAILIDSIPHILPRLHFGEALKPVDELTRRVRYFFVPYNTDLEEKIGRNSISGSVLAVVVVGLIARQIYEASFMTTTTVDLATQIWAASDFAKFCMRCLPGNGKEEDLSPGQLRLLRQAMAPGRSMFYCPMPAPFSLIDYCRRNLAPTIDEETMRVLARMPKLYSVGYCRNQADWGQNGDYVAVIPGCYACLIIRPAGVIETAALAKVISEAYVCGIMNGEALSNGLPEAKVTLI